mmetsp:Transcript_13426/g.38122  ORF Transcript_13426/g.38122 Transcript_13426/m.38122 type:complete len:264 (+) Transcript_13426:1173-1964(+)
MRSCISAMGTGGASITVNHENPRLQLCWSMERGPRLPWGYCTRKYASGSGCRWLECRLMMTMDCTTSCGLPNSLSRWATLSMLWTHMAMAICSQALRSARCLGWLMPLTRKPSAQQRIDKSLQPCCPTCGNRTGQVLLAAPRSLRSSNRWTARRFPRTGGATPQMLRPTGTCSVPWLVWNGSCTSHQAAKKPSCSTLFCSMPMGTTRQPGRSLACIWSAGAALYATTTKTCAFLWSAYVCFWSSMSPGAPRGTAFSLTSATAT